jgi:hypothetical protein
MLLLKKERPYNPCSVCIIRHLHFLPYVAVTTAMEYRVVWECALMQEFDICTQYLNRVGNAILERYSGFRSDRGQS